MSFSEMAFRMWPFWILGIAMIGLTLRSKHKDLLAVNQNAVFEWMRLLLIATIARMALFYFFKDHYKESSAAIAGLPILGTLTVFWEDAAHTLPLLLFRRFIGESKIGMVFYVIAMLLIMASFGSGHVYQGGISAFIISFYIPFTIKLAKKYGLGTIMICHVLYDLITVSTVQGFLK